MKRSPSPAHSPCRLALRFKIFRRGPLFPCRSGQREPEKGCNKLTDFISIKVRGALAERCAAFAYKGCKLAASGDFETICFAEDPTRQPGFLIKANEVEFLSPKKVEEAAGVAGDTGTDADAA